MTSGNDSITAKLEERLNSISAEDIMTENVITIKNSMSLADLAEMFISSRISGVPVVDAGDEMEGIITATDLFLLIDMMKSGAAREGGHEHVHNPTVKFAMTTEVCTVEKSTTLEEIIALMKMKNIHTIPVCEGGDIVGVIGRRDVMKTFYAELKKLGEEGNA